MNDTDLALFKQEMHYMSEKIDKIDKRLESFENKLDGFIEKADQRYASKNTETVIKRIGGAMGVAIIGALMKLILIG